MRIAIVGAGISGLVCAHLLHRDHEITVFEANDYIGGHTRTVRVDRGDEVQHVDTGFIVFNEKNYPNFCRLLEQLGVDSQPSDMSFSLRCDRTGLEYRGSSLNTLFAQRRNLFRPRFHRLVREILRFFREAPALLENPDDELTLERYLQEEGYSQYFLEQHVLPLGAALWSAPADQLRDFPAWYFVRFFQNHDMLQVKGRPTWRVVRGGSSTYVEPLTREFADRIRLSTPVEEIRRTPGAVELKSRGSEMEQFDHVILACHSDQALAILIDANDLERQTLEAIPYRANRVQLHTDSSILPRRRRAWAAWNYRNPAEARDAVSVTYHMNRLQTLRSREEFCVSLNCENDIDPDRVIFDTVYDHPVYTPPAMAAQQRHTDLNDGRTSFCGAYWGFGFHEDGVKSALRVCENFGKSLDR